MVSFSPPCKGTVRRQTFVNQEERPHHVGTPVSDSGPLELWEINVSCWNQPVYSIPLEQSLDTGVCVCIYIEREAKRDTQREMFPHLLWFNLNFRLYDGVKGTCI